MFDVTTTSSTGCRVAIITSRTSDGKACVLANYRGMGQREVNAAYEFLIPKMADENPHVWKVAHCSVAAPFFFRSKSLPGFGALQDGGVRANNPLAIALKESVVIWPSAKTHDLLLSVGTGSFSSVAKPIEGASGILQDSAIPRMIRATMSSPCMDGEQGFHEALNFVPDVERSNIFRLNHELPEPLPRLDDVRKLEEMSKMHFTVPTELVRTILATAFFFFELDELPIKSQGAFFCKGSVLCSRSYSRDLVKLVRVEFPGAMFETARGQRLGDVDDDDGCRVCGYYRKKVGFSINGLHEMTSIGIAGSSFFQRIGGFPKSVQELLDDQQANSHFGRADHLVASWPPKRNCYCSPRVKRHIKFLEPALIHKKRRL
ncbi:Zinc finger, RING-type [Penicillium digitatum]|uniref:Zinc finger, RING-type n=1 Tax=Penicillium digitatum TaxID=36651 RepID=A0A7T6XHA9_PENDI|nr:Zinc finger, RING-type [Penicillium digitatum]